MVLAADLCFHPPVLLSSELAQGGETVLPAILSRLEATESVDEKIPLLNVLAIMSCNYYDLRKEPAAIDISTRAVESMDSPFKPEGITLLSEITREACPVLWTPGVQLDWESPGFTPRDSN
jgi:hypothetical protein